jgi:hypothetical protein
MKGPSTTPSTCFGRRGAGKARSIFLTALNGQRKPLTASQLASLVRGNWSDLQEHCESCVLYGNKEGHLT